MFQHPQPAIGFRDVGIAAIPSVACEDRRDHPAYVRRLVRVEDDLLESARIPCLDKGAESIHACLQGFGVIALPVDGFAAKLARDRVRGEACRLERDRHAAGKHRVEEFAGVAEQCESLAPQRFDVGCVADDVARRRVPHGVLE